MPPINQLYRTVLRSIIDDNTRLLETAKRGLQGKIPYNNPKKWDSEKLLQYLSYDLYDPRAANIRRLKPHVQNIKGEIRGIPKEYQQAIDIQPFNDNTYRPGYVGAYNSAWRNPTLRPSILYDSYSLLHEPGILTHEFLHHANPSLDEQRIRALTRERLRQLNLQGGE